MQYWLLGMGLGMLKWGYTRITSFNFQVRYNVIYTYNIIDFFLTHHSFLVPSKWLHHLDWIEGSLPTSLPDSPQQTGAENTCYNILYDLLPSLIPRLAQGRERSLGTRIRFCLSDLPQATILIHSDGPVPPPSPSPWEWRDHKYQRLILLPKRVMTNKEEF